jgi:CheY-like chemotaxis protein
VSQLSDLTYRYHLVSHGCLVRLKGLSLKPTGRRRFFCCTLGVIVTRMGHRVLIFDDHASIRSRLGSRFEAQGFEVRDAANGPEGVETAKACHPDVIILDLSMPVMNGLEAARALREQMPGIPLLLFTNTVGPIIKQEAFSAGIVSVFSKSDSPDLVVDVKTRLAD